jgi:TP901-1 family phage major tail protein
MAKYIGNDMVLKIMNTTYQTIAGCLSHTLTINNEVIDVSDKDSNRWSDKISAGQRSLAVSFNGWVSDDAEFALMEAAAEGDTIVDLQLAYGNGKTVTGNFHVDSFEYTGEYNGAQAFSCTLSNDGVPTFA